MMIADKIRLVPTEEQASKFRQFCGTARFTYNTCLAYKMEAYEYEGITLNNQDLVEHIQDLKYSEEYSWLQDIPETVTKHAIRDLDNAYKRFFKGESNFPKFKRKNKCKQSFYVRSDFSGNTCRLRKIDDSHIKITGIKTPIRTKQPLRELNKYSNARISFDGKYWFLTYSFEVEENEPIKDGETIGVDLGIKDLAVTSDRRVYENINKTRVVKQLEARLRRKQRQLSRKYEMNKQGNKYVKTNNIKKLEDEIRLIHKRLKDIRDTYIHQVTYDLVKTKPSQIVIEDLNVSGMMKNKHLAKSIQNQEWFKFRQYLTYKCKFYGTELILVDRYYPSTKRCSCCGNDKKYISLSERTYICDKCGTKIDRDYNAAINLRNYALTT